MDDVGQAIWTNGDHGLIGGFRKVEVLKEAQEKVTSEHQEEIEYEDALGVRIMK